MGILEESELFQQLHQDYFESKDDREQLNLRNAIFEQVATLLSRVVWYYSNKGIGMDWDMYQAVAERTLNTVIPQWTPGQGSLEGYYKRCFRNACLNYLAEVKRKTQLEDSVDPLNCTFWNHFTAGEEEKAIKVHPSFQFEDEVKQEVYELCLIAIQTEAVERKQKAFLKGLATEYNLTHKEIRMLYNHAIITCRESYHLLIGDYKQVVCSETLFGRLCELLDTDTIQHVVKIFGGMKINIPEWKGQ